MNLDLIPKEWTDLLLKIQTVDPMAIIAGGALRDLDNDKEVKDLDIFVSCPDFELKDIIGECCIDKQAPSDIPDTDIISSTVYLVAGITIPVNIVTCAKHEDFLLQQLNRFDIGICKVGYDGRTFIQTSAYIRDKECKELVIYNSSWMPGSLARIARIGKKYPNWKQFLNVPTMYPSTEYQNSTYVELQQHSS